MRSFILRILLPCSSLWVLHSSSFASAPSLPAQIMKRVPRVFYPFVFGCWKNTTVPQAMCASLFLGTSEMPDIGEVSLFGSWLSGLPHGDNPGWSVWSRITKLSGPCTFFLPFLETGVFLVNMTVVGSDFALLAFTHPVHAYFLHLLFKLRINPKPRW